MICHGHQLPAFFPFLGFAAFRIHRRKSGRLPLLSTLHEISSRDFNRSRRKRALQRRAAFQALCHMHDRHTHTAHSDRARMHQQKIQMGRVSAHCCRLYPQRRERARVRPHVFGQNCRRRVCGCARAGCRAAYPVRALFVSTFASGDASCSYTTPIKALSNQKFREFCETFGAAQVRRMAQGCSGAARNYCYHLTLTECTGWIVDGRCHR